MARGAALPTPSKRVQLAAMKRLVREFGAEVMVSIAPPQQMTNSARARARVETVNQVRACRDCDLYKGCTSPVPPSWPNDSLTQLPKFAVIGEAPGPEEDREGEPFIGRAGKLIRRVLTELGVYPNSVAWMNAAACFPRTGERGFRAPTDEELRACQQNLMQSLMASGARYVLLTGARALTEWRTDLRVTTAQGRLGVWMGRWYVYPILHPSAILRGGDMNLWRQTIRGFIDIVDENQGTRGLATDCQMCGARIWGYDPDGVAWCELHFPRGINGRDATKRHWSHNVTGPLFRLHTDEEPERRKRTKFVDIEVKGGRL